MSALKAVGLFLELEMQAYEGGLDLSFLPQLRANTNQLDAVTCKEICAQLARSTPCFDILMTIADPISGRPIPGGLSIETDGVWVWRAYLHDIVRDYRPRLPADFVQHALSPDDAKSPVVVTRELIQQANQALSLHYAALRDATDSVSR
jgi:hypothetical protein